MLTVLVALNAVLLLFVIASGIVAWRIFTRARDTLVSFVASPDGKEPSPLALTVQSMSKVAAGEFAMSIKATLMGQASGISRALDGAQQDIMADALTAKSPLLGALLDFSPSLKKRLGKMNPMAVMALADIAGKVGAKKPANGNGASTPGESNQMGMSL